MKDHSDTMKIARDFVRQFDDYEVLEKIARAGLPQYAIDQLVEEYGEVIGGTIADDVVSLVIDRLADEAEAILAAEEYEASMRSVGK